MEVVQAKTKYKKIVCVHLLNDYSGAPNVLKTAIQVFIEKGYEVDLIVNKETIGFLTGLNVRYNLVSYNFNKNTGLTFIKLLWYQLQVFIKILHYHRSDCIILINGIYPFAAALAGKLIHKKVMYYIHESRVHTSFFKKFFFIVSETFSNYNIFVSNFIKCEDKSRAPKETVYNTLDARFFNIPYNSGKYLEENSFNIIFIGSLKVFKGIYTFLELAKTMEKNTDIQFFMMLNGDKEKIKEFIKKSLHLKNIHFLSNENHSIHDIYARGDLLLNLSIPKLWIETFGLTILEGFAYGIPAIVPNIGGPLEVVDHNINGFHVDTENIEAITTKIQSLYTNRSLHKQFRANAKLKAATFNYDVYKHSLLTIIERFNGLE